MDLMTRVRSQADRLLAVATAVAGVVVLIVGWFGVSGSPYPAEQLPYLISGGIGALFLLGVASALWLSADLRDEWRKLDRIERAIRDAGAEQWAGDDLDDDLGRDIDDVEPEPATRRLPRVGAGSGS